MFRKAAVILFAITWEAVLTSNHCLQLLLQGKLPCKLFIVFMKAAQKLFAVAGEAVLYIVYCCYRASCSSSCSFCWWKLLSNCSLLQEKLFYTLSTVVTGQAVLQAGPAAVCATIPNTHPSDPSLQVTRIGNIQSRGAVDALFASTVLCGVYCKCNDPFFRTV